MGAFGDAVKYLYQNFILRDILSFVTPGAIIFLTAFLMFIPESSLAQRLATLFEYSHSIHWLLYIPLFGVFYMIGFAVQCFGEIIGIIRVHRYAKGCCRQRCRIFWCNWDAESNIWWRKAHEEVVKFHKKAERVEWAGQQHERLVVLKQMCANGFLAMVIAASLIPINHYGKSPLFLLIVGIPLLVSLFWGYRVHELRMDTMDKEIRRLL